MDKMRETVSVDETIKFLNGLVCLDGNAVLELVENRVSCNGELACHCSVQVMENGDRPGSWVGMLGILNGLFGVDEEGSGQITAVFDEEGRLAEFRRTDEGLRLWEKR